LRINLICFCRRAKALLVENEFRKLEKLLKKGKGVNQEIIDDRLSKVVKHCMIVTFALGIPSNKEQALALLTWAVLLIAEGLAPYKTIGPSTCYAMPHLKDPRNLYLQRL
jgi:hypothetical protein